MALYNSLNEKRLQKRRGTYAKLFWKFIVCLYSIVVVVQTLQFTPLVNAAPTDLKVYAEAPSFARLDTAGVQDPSGWFFQAVLYNPTSTDIVVNGLRWWYNSSVQIIDTSKSPFDARCYDTRYFSVLPSTALVGNREIRWEYAAGTVSLNVPARKMIVTWIEVPTKSIDNAALTLASYYVEARVGNQWLLSPIYPSHAGDNSAVSAVFRADFNLTTSPAGETQTHPNPQWLFNEERSVIVGLSRRVRLIPTASGKGQGINTATINVTLPSGWSYVTGSSFNPYGETITYFNVSSRDRLRWNLNRDVIVYSANQSLAQNYIEFNVTAPSTPTIYNFTVSFSITSISGLTTVENRFIYAYVMSPPTAFFTFSPASPLVNQSTTFNASSSSDLDGNIQDYSWDFGDSQTGTGVAVSHAYSTVGNYTVKLTVTDNDGLEGLMFKVVMVIMNPLASFTFSPTSPLVNETITFDASASTPNGGSITDYFWDFGDNQTGVGVVTAHAYSANGNYTVVLNVTDSEELWDAETKTVTISQKPQAVFSHFPFLPLVNQTVNFNASLSTPNGGLITSFTWDFGDGGIGTGALATHVYTNLGDFTVTLTIIDSEGLSDAEAEIIRIGANPFASFTYSPAQPWVSSTVAFNASSSRDSDGLITLYQWNFGDGNVTAVFDSITSHVYNASGNFTVTLTVADNDGFSSFSSKILMVVIRDVAILSVSPSAIEVQRGQQVNVTVMVKNQGTTSESFNVTVYFNSTKLGTQSIINLAPNEQITLNFTWNTGGLTEGAVYTLRAETSQIPNEIETADNSLTGNNVRIAETSLPSTSTPPYNFWDTALPYAIPIGAIIGSFALFAALVVLRRPKQVLSPSETLPSELQPFVDMTGGELPDAYSVMIVGDASAGKSILCQQLAQRYLSQRKPCVYVTYDCFPDEIRENMKGFKWDISTHEQNENFVFVDCYSAIAGKSSQEKYFVKQPFSLSELGIGISTAMSGLEQKSARVFLDSTAPLFTRLESTKVVEFLQDRSAQIKGENGSFFFIIGKGTVQEDLRRRLEEIVDCIIELEVHEEKGETVRKMHIKKLRGRRFSDQWMSFKIDMKKGFVLSVPKHSQKSPK